MKRDEENKYFKQALNQFATDVASGGAIRHLADLGHSPGEICGMLDFPTPLSVVGEVMFQHFLETKVILMEPPDHEEFYEKVSYKKEYDSYGRTSLRRVVERVPREHSQYVKCDYGRWKYKDPAGFERMLAKLDGRDASYIRDLPWPLSPVWHMVGEGRILPQPGSDYE